MMIKARKLSIAIAVVGPLAIVAAGKSFAGPINTVALKAAVPVAATEVQYRPYYYYPGYSYYPAYSYWGYPAYAYWGYPGYYGYNYAW